MSVVQHCWAISHIRSRLETKSGTQYPRKKSAGNWKRSLDYFFDNCHQQHSLVKMTEEAYPKTLYVGNLDQSVTEDLLCALFGQMGSVKSCKIIREASSDPYAFIEYSNHQSAQTALAAMNKRLFLKKEIKVNWATSPGNQPKTDTSQHHHMRGFCSVRGNFELSDCP